MSPRIPILTLLFLGVFALGVFAQDASTSNFQDNNFFKNQDLQIENQVELFPNPTLSHLFVEIKNSNLEIIEFEMHSIIGTKITVDFEEISEDKYRIAVEELNPGYYFLVIKDKPTRYNQAFKFVKK